MLENGPTLALFVLFIRRHISGCCVLYAKLKHRNQALTKNKVRETFFGLPFFSLRVDRQAVSLVLRRHCSGINPHRNQSTAQLRNYKLLIKWGKQRIRIGP